MSDFWTTTIKCALMATPRGVESARLGRLPEPTN
jgi:hypothetical protein